MDVSYSTIPDGIISADMLDVRGIYPSTCIIEAVIQDHLDTDPGTLTFSWNGQVREWTQCAINRASMRYSVQRPTMSFQVWDRRWKWRNAVFSGYLNRRGPDGKLIQEEQKSARELGDILLRLLGATTHDVSGLPTNVWPTAEWQCVNPALMLARLCDETGCDVVLGMDDRVRIVAKGEGDDLPDNEQIRYPSSQWNTSRIPNRVVLCCAPTLYQKEWRLEAVGIEPTGEVKKIDQLSYKGNGWEKQWYCSFPEVSGVAKWCAFSTVWRWYRIIHENIEACPEPIEDLEQLLPVNDWIFDPKTDTGKAAPCFITGVFWPQSDFNLMTVAGTPYSGPFKMLRDKGIAESEYPIVGLSSDDYIEPALKLTTTCNVKYRDGTGHVRELFTRNVGGSGKDVLLVRPDLFRAVSQYVDTMQEVSTEANAHLDAYCRQFSAGKAEEREYVGLVPVSLDGAIAQARYRGGMRQSLTNISRNMEFDVFSRDTVHRQRMRAADLVTGRL